MTSTLIACPQDTLLSIHYIYPPTQSLTHKLCNHTGIQASINYENASVHNLYRESRLASEQGMNMKLMVFQ